MMLEIYNESFENSGKCLSENMVDLFWLDPPYFITKGKNSNMDLEGGDRNDWDRQWNNKEEYREWTKTYLQLAFNQLKPTGSIYVCSDWRNSNIIQEELENCGFTIQNRITWKRDKGRGSKSNWKSIHEDIWFATKHPTNYVFNVEEVMVEKKVIAPYTNTDGSPKDWWINESGEKIRKTYPSNLWTEFCVPYWSMLEVRSYAKTKKTPGNTLTKHNTQKPKDLVKKCIIASTNEEDLVVDYFAGSGTTLISSKELNRNCVVFEINKTYIQIIETRLKNEK